MRCLLLSLTLTLPPQAPQLPPQAPPCLPPQAPLPKPPVVTPNPLPKAEEPAPVKRLVTAYAYVPVGRGHVHSCPCGNEWTHAINPTHDCDACGRTVTLISRWGPTTVRRRVRQWVTAPAAPQPAAVPQVLRVLQTYSAPAAAPLCRT